MLEKFIDFVDSVLPSVSPNNREAAKEAISQFKKEGHQIKYLTLQPLEQLSQGDIISKVPFSYFGKDGRQKTFTADALVISTSCHIDQKNQIVLVPVFPLEGFAGNMSDLQKNTIFDYMYIPDGLMSDKFVDFEIMNTYDRDLIMDGIATNKIQRIGSLNQIGYYFFIVKLTVYLMRKEDNETFSERKMVYGY